MQEDNFYKIFTSVNPGIDSKEIYFEKLSYDGLEEMHAYSIDPRLYEFFEFAPFNDIADTTQYINKLTERMNNSNGNTSSQYWFVRNKSDDSMIGSAGLTSLDHGRKSIEWGYGIDPELWGKGYVLQIQEALKQYTFDVLELNRLHGITMINNHRTIESVLASGMKHEGIARDYYCKDRIFVDGWTYAMIAKDYDDLKNSTKNNNNNTITEATIISIIKSVLPDEHNLDKNSSMENTDNWDSLTHMILMVELRESLKIDLSPSDIAEATSVESIINLVNKNN